MMTSKSSPSSRLLALLILPLLVGISGFTGCSSSPPTPDATRATTSTSGSSSAQGGSTTAAANPDSPKFTEVAEASGIHYQWEIAGQRPLNILQTIGNGVAFLDYDND